MDVEQFLLLRLQNQYLLNPHPAEEVVRGLIGIQAQLGAPALHALAIRTCGRTDFSQFVKTWSFRGTLHLHHRLDLPLVLYHGSETDYGQIALSEEFGTNARSEYFRSVVLDALTAGDLSRDQIKEAFFSAGMTGQEAVIILHSKGGLLRALAERGEIAYVADRNLIFTRMPPMDRMEQQPALVELVRRYLQHYAPVSLHDAQTFFGLPQRMLKQLLEETATECFPFAGQTYYTPSQTLPAEATAPEVLFLAAFDQMLLGYRKTENPILPQDRLKTVYNDNGIIFATVLLHGIVRAIWRRTNAQIEIYPIGTIPALDKRTILRRAGIEFSGAAVQWIEA